MRQKKPNVLFLLTDDQRFNTIHALGNDVVQTPNLDRLVHRGAAFTHAHIPSGTVGAVCMPSRAMLNTGRTLFHIEGNGQTIPADHVTMGQNFLNNGYNSFGTGKWHNGVDGYAKSFNAGENIFFGGMWDHWNVPVNDYAPDGKYENTIHYTSNFTFNHQTVEVRAQKINAGKHSTELFSESAIKYIEEYNDDKPFFMYVSFLAPHDPRTMPERFRTMYKAEDMVLPDNFATMPAVNFGWATKGRDENLETYPRRPEVVKQHMADYYGMISHIDWCVGNMIDALEKKGQLENTIIVFCGDNGLSVGQHGLMGKQNLYEHSIRIPLLMSGPGIPTDFISDRYVYLLDIFPTLCELCGVSTPATVEGRSFVKLFYDKKASIREDLYFAFHAKIRGVKERRYKLIEYRTENLKLTQLFDLQNDPLEMNNMFDIEGYEEITERLRNRLYEMRDEWEDETHPFGKRYWELYRLYAQAETGNVDPFKGRNPVAAMGITK